MGPMWAFMFSFTIKCFPKAFEEDFVIAVLSRCLENLQGRKATPADAELNYNG